MPTLIDVLTGGGEEDTSPPADWCMQHLDAFAARYGQPCPYDVGSFVTARALSRYRGAGEPCKVLEVIPRRTQSCPKCGEVEHVDMRIARIVAKGNLQTFWVESEHYEPYSKN